MRAALEHPAVLEYPGVLERVHKGADQGVPVGCCRPGAQLQGGCGAAVGQQLEVVDCGEARGQGGVGGGVGGGAEGGLVNPGRWCW